MDSWCQSPLHYCAVRTSGSPVYDAQLWILPDFLNVKLYAESALPSAFVLLSTVKSERETAL